MDCPDTDMAEYMWSNYTIRNVLVFTSQFCFPPLCHHSLRFIPCGDKNRHQKQQALSVTGNRSMARDCFYSFNFSRIPMLASDSLSLISMCSPQTDQWSEAWEMKLSYWPNWGCSNVLASRKPGEFQVRNCNSWILDRDNQQAGNRDTLKQRKGDMNVNCSQRCGLYLGKVVNDSEMSLR